MRGRAAKTVWELDRDARPPAVRALDASLWLAQAVLALVFGIAGGATLTLSVAELSLFAPWARTVSEATLSLVGAAELVGALGVIVPALTRVRPGLTPLAALLLAGIAGLSIWLHVDRDELAKLPFPAALLVLALFVAWGRGRALPLRARPRPIVID